MSGLLGMLGGAHPPKEAKPKKATKKAKPSTTSSSRAKAKRPRKTTASTPTSIASSAPSRRAKTISPSVKAKRGGASSKKRGTPSSTPASSPEKHQPIIPLSNMQHNTGLNPLALPKGFKRRAVIYAGHKVPTTDKIIYAEEKFVIEGAVWFEDYKQDTKVRFQIFHPKMKFGLSILPEDLKIGEKNLTGLAKAMLKHAGR